MPRLLSSVYSDPIASAIQSFSTITSAVDSIENSKQRRQLNALQIQADQMNLDQQKKLHGAIDNLQNILNNPSIDSLHTMLKVPEALKDSEEASQKGEEWKPSDEHKEAIITALAHSRIASDDPKDIPLQAGAAMRLSQFMNNNKDMFLKSVGDYRLDSDKFPEIVDDYNTLYKSTIKQGSDKFGLTVDKDGVDKNVSAVLLHIDKDPKKSTVSFALNVKSPVNDGQVFKHIGPTSAIISDPEHMGNIDLSQRPVVRNADGSISTLLSTSFEEDGKEILIPTISSSGKKMSKEDAIKAYHDPKSDMYHKQLGIYDTVEEANQAAERLHSLPMWKKDVETYGAKGKKSIDYVAGMTYGHSGAPDSTIAQVPLMLQAQQIFMNNQLFSAAQKIQMLTKPEAWAADYIAKVQQRDIDEAAIQTFRAMPKGLSGQDRWDWLMSNKPDNVPLKEWAEMAKTPASTILTPWQMTTQQERQRHNLTMEAQSATKPAEKAAEDAKKEKDRREDMATKERWHKEDLATKRDETAGKKKDTDDEKETKRRDTEIDNLEKDREKELNAPSKSGVHLLSKGKGNKDKDINEKYDKARELIRNGTVRTWSEAKAKVEGARGKNEDKLDSAIADYTKTYDPAKYKGTEVTDPSTGVTIVSDGKQWKKKEKK